MLYDVIIIGAGPAGLSAALYAGRARLSTLLIEKAADGGQISLTAEIENYPGSMLENESGKTLTARMAAQAARFGAERVADNIVAVDLNGEIKTVTGENGEYQSKAVIIATGARPRPIGCENEADFVGLGVSFCAICDASFFTGREVYVVGGGDAAVEEAIYLTGFARKVTLIHRRDELRAAKSIQEKAFANEKLSFVWDSVVERVDGEGLLERITVRNVKTGERTVFAADPADGLIGLFGFIGYLPNTDLFAGQVPLEDGYIRTDENMFTGVPGVFAAGDVRLKSLRQVITAAADGAIAAVQAERSLR